MNIGLADRIVTEARYRSWAWVVGNAADYGMTRSEMLAFWRRNDHMTPHNPYPVEALKGGARPAVEPASPTRTVAGAGR
jgi:hypothetical protein